MHFASAEYKSEASYNHALHVKPSARVFSKSFHPMYPLERASCFSKGHAEAAGGDTGSPGHAAHCGAPSRSTASSHGPRDALPDRPGRAGTLGTRAAQPRLLLTSPKITGFLAAGRTQNVTFVLILKLGHKHLAFSRECSRKPLLAAQMGTAKYLENNLHESW